MMKRTIRDMLLAAGLIVSVSLSAYSQPPGPANEQCDAGGSGPGGHDSAMHAPPPGMQQGPMLMPELGLPPFLHGIDLSEAQQDKIFSLMLANAPLLREQEKLAGKSDKELHALLASNEFDEGKIKALAETHARAMAQIVVLHARGMHQILALLTPEQHAQVDAMRAKFEAHQGLRAQIEDMRPKMQGHDGPGKD